MTTITTVGRRRTATAGRTGSRAASRLPDLAGVALPLVLFCLFMIVPMIVAVALSFTTWNGLGAPRWAGWSNWTRFFTPIAMALGFFTAGRERYRTVYELIDAMLVDGGTEWTVFRQPIWPMSRPVLATLSIYNGLNVWNNFLLPLVLTQSNNVAVLPLGLTKLQGLYSVNVPAVMAGVLLSAVPLLALFIVMRRQVMNSLGGITAR